MRANVGPTTDRVMNTPLSVPSAIQSAVSDPHLERPISPRDTSNISAALNLSERGSSIGSSRECSASDCATSQRDSRTLVPETSGRCSLEGRLPMMKGTRMRAVKDAMDAKRTLRRSQA